MSPVVTENSNIEWKMFKSFFVAKKEFDEIERTFHEKFEEVIGKFAGRKGGKPKKHDFDAFLSYHLLEDFRDKHLFDLKERAHNVLHSSPAMDLLDSYLSDIFHQASILKEEHYRFRKYVPRFFEEKRPDEAEGIVAEIRERLPHLVSRIGLLFKKAEEQLVKVLPDLAANPIFLRSFHLFGKGISIFQERGEDWCYQQMFPHGTFEAYCRLGKLFFESGFVDEARKCFLKSFEVSHEAKKRDAAFKKIEKELAGYLDRLPK